MSVYKVEKPGNLDRALQSVWDDQTHRPDEIVLIADGPLTRELDEVIEKWNQSLGESFILCRNDVNLGLTKSLNKGLKLAKGELIARMDCDDISHPRRFEKQHAFLLENSDIDVVGGAIQEFNDENECIAVRSFPTDSKIILKYIGKASPLAHPAVMMRKRIFESGISYDERFRTSQDLALWFDVLDNGYKISNIPDVVLYFRFANDVFKRRSRDKAFNEFRIYMNGIYRLKGLFTISYIYPITRLAFRLMPKRIIKLVYESNFRNKLLSNR